MASKKTSTRRGWKRRLGIAGGVIAVSLGGFFGALHFFPSFGPAVADGVRAVVGPGPVAWAEDTVYGLEDKIESIVYRDAPPKTYWEAPANAPTSPREPKLASNNSETPTPVVFKPADFEPPIPKVATPIDGKWIATDASETPLIYKTMVHPDAKRSYSAVAVVAIDLARAKLSIVAGVVEPVSPALPRERRTGIVPKERWDDLLAAFNGGFKVEHGHWGSMFDGVTLVPPRDNACTLAIYKGDALRIGTWSAIKGTESEMSSWRQTPPCLVEGGAIHEKLQKSDESHGWGAAVDGETVIRRSAVGISKDRSTLFYAIGDGMTAGALARAMLAVGCEDAAQLDVNASYPRFLFYGRDKIGEMPKATSALIPDIQFKRHEYLSEPEGRDFFYLTKKP